VHRNPLRAGKITMHAGPTCHKHFSVPWALKVYLSFAPAFVHFSLSISLRSADLDHDSDRGDDGCR